VNALIANRPQQATSSPLESIRKRPPFAKAGFAPRSAGDSDFALGKPAKARPPQSTETDDELVYRTQAGDRSAFAQLVERYQRRILQLALGFVRNERDAEEVVQDAFLRVHLSITGFRGTSSFYTWLYRIVVNLAIDSNRRPHKQRVAWESIAESANDSRALELPRMINSDPLEALTRMELSQRISMAMTHLAPYHRAVIIMREIDGMSYQEMAESLRISKGTVMSRLFHARRRLQRSLSNELIEYQIANLGDS